MDTTVFCVVQSDVAGVWGYVEMRSGNIVQNYISEEEEDIEGAIAEKLEEKNIKIPLYMFREVVQNIDWKIIAK